MSEAGTWPASTWRSDLSSVTRAVTLTTESSGRPAVVAGRNTLPGMVASRGFEVMMATSAVSRRLALKELAWITSTGRGFPGLLHSGFPRSAHQTLPRRITNHPRQPDDRVLRLPRPPQRHLSPLRPA